MYNCWSVLVASLEHLPDRGNLSQLFSLGITLVDVHLNWISWLYFLILEENILVILIDCMGFLSPFLDVTTMSMLTVSFLAAVSFLA